MVRALRRLWGWLASERGAGWTVTGVATDQDAYRAEGHLKTKIGNTVVPAGQRPEWLDFVQQVAKEFGELCRRNKWGTQLKVDANNGGAGDAQGVGVLTITLTTS